MSIPTKEELMVMTEDEVAVVAERLRTEAEAHMAHADELEHFLRGRLGGADPCSAGTVELVK